MSGDGKQQEARLNTDRELWRGPSRAEFGDPDRFYADSIFVTADDKGIGLNCGGYVIVKPIREWFALAARQANQPSQQQHQTLECGCNLIVTNGQPTEVGSTSEQYRDQGYENLVVGKRIDPIGNWGIAVADKILSNNHTDVQRAVTAED